MSTRPLSSASTLSAVDQQLGISPSVTSIDEESLTELDEKISADVQNPTEPAAATPQRHWWSWKLQPSAASSDPEKGGKQTERKLVMIGPIYAGCGAAMAACECKFHFFFLVF